MFSRSHFPFSGRSAAIVSVLLVSLFFVRSAHSQITIVKPNPALPEKPAVRAVIVGESADFSDDSLHQVVKLQRGEIVMVFDTLLSDQTGATKRVIPAYHAQRVNGSRGWVSEDQVAFFTSLGAFDGSHRVDLDQNGRTESIWPAAVTHRDGGEVGEVGFMVISPMGDDPSLLWPLTRRTAVGEERVRTFFIRDMVGEPEREITYVIDRIDMAGTATAELRMLSYEDGVLSELLSMPISANTDRQGMLEGEGVEIHRDSIVATRVRLPRAGGEATVTGVPEIARRTLVWNKKANRYDPPRIGRSEGLSAIAKSAATLRESPTASSRKVKELRAGAAVAVLASADEAAQGEGEPTKWIKLRTADGMTGWVAMKEIELPFQFLEAMHTLSPGDYSAYPFVRFQ